jgi:hypothetical protein
MGSSSATGGALSSPSNHPVGIRLAQLPACERIRFPDSRAEQRPLGIHFEIDSLDVRFQIIRQGCDSPARRGAYRPFRATGRIRAALDEVVFRFHTDRGAFFHAIWRQVCPRTGWGQPRSFLGHARFAS